MKRVSLVQVGLGTVGGTVVEQVLEHRGRWRDEFGIDIAISAVVTRSGAEVADSPAGLDAERLRTILSDRRSGAGGGIRNPGLALDAVARACVAGPAIVLDAGAGDATTDLLVAALEQGAGVVLSNKAPLALPMTDPRTATLWSHTGAFGRLRYEATCGAGLPVISTLQALLDTGDTLLEISGTLSGTFGAIFSDVGAGVPFSEAVRTAKANGYTEPDPRDDLSGLDVARKALILARTIGESIDLEDIAVHSLVPSHLTGVSIAEFLDGIGELDADIERQAAEARDSDASLKYMMHWVSGSSAEVGLRAAARATVLGALQGPENIVSFRTARYDQYPCVVSGPGAGAAVTAGGMVADMLALAHRLAA